MTSGDGVEPAGAPTCTVRADAGTPAVDTSFPVVPGLAVLHAMIRAAQHCIPVGCRGGGCGVCRVRVLDGAYATKRMSRRHVSVDDEADRIVLACRLLPSSDIIVERAPAPAVPPDPFLTPTDPTPSRPTQPLKKERTWP